MMHVLRPQGCITSVLQHVLPEIRAVTQWPSHTPSEKRLALAQHLALTQPADLRLPALTHSAMH